MRRDLPDIFGGVCAVALVVITALWLFGMLRLAVQFAFGNLF